MTTPTIYERAPALRQSVSTNFQWRQAGGKGLIRPSDMATGHLFNTLKMIWNNSAPFEHRIQPIRLYHFDPKFYTADYMTKAVEELSAELSARDLNTYQFQCLSHMERTLKGLIE